MSNSTAKNFKADSVTEKKEAKPKKLSFKQKMMLQREDLIIETVNGLLATKGYDAMTVDEIAEEVGIAKASLYRHFPGKEALAIGALLSTMELGIAEIDKVNATKQKPLEKLKTVTQWAMRLKLNKKMPNLPSENSQLRELLLENDTYMDAIVTMSDSLGEWIEEAQADGSLASDVAPICILYTLYARACDPVLGFLKQSGMFDDDQIIDMVTTTCCNGLVTS